MTNRYVHIKETRCGKCKKLKPNPAFRAIYKLTSSYPFICEAHREALPEIVKDIFADKCQEFEPK